MKMDKEIRDFKALSMVFLALVCPLVHAGETGDLFERGRSRVYEGKYLDAISMPLGGIGSGGVQINGKARLVSWQIFNNFDPLTLPHTFFAVRVARQGAKPVISK